MTQLVKRSEFPTLSADPRNLVVDHGFPLHRFKTPNRYLKLLQENQVLARTNDYKPTPFTLKRQVDSTVRYILLDIPELKNSDKAQIKDVVFQDIELNREFEHMDPLKGNSLVVTDYLDGFELYLFSGGPSLSHLVILTSKKSCYNTNQYQLHLPSDEITVKDTLHLSYPIRQIQLSPLSTLFKKTFLVRTTSTIHVFQINSNQDIQLVHQVVLYELSLSYPSIDYSMPIHIEPSPYYELQYLFITNNGYSALMDGSNDKIIFENVDPIPEHITYKSRWKSCGFGKTPFTIYIASPECIKEFVIRDTEIEAKILAAPNDRIVAFKASNRLLYCFATLDKIVVMDRMAPEKPIVTWLHKMRDGPPAEIMMDQLINDNWRITAFSYSTQRFTMMHLHYVNNPTKNIEPVVKILEIHNFQLSVEKCEEIYNYTSRIHSVGCSLKINARQIRDTTKGDVFLSLFRSFEDGSLKVQYMAFNKEKDQDNNNVLSLCPQYHLVSLNKQFSEMMLDFQIALLPVREGFMQGLAEICDLDMTHFKNHLSTVSTSVTGSNTLDADYKFSLIENIRHLKSTTTFRDLFNQEEYQDYTLEELTDFLQEMELDEPIERARQIDIPGIAHHAHQTPMDTDLRNKLKQAHEKQIQLSSLLIRPLRDADDHFQYLNRDTQFTSTMTTRVFANLWHIDDTRYDQLVFPPSYRTNRVVETEKFPSQSIYKRKRQQQEGDDGPIQEEISMPVAASELPPVIMKTGISKSIPIVLSEDEEEDQITPARLALSIGSQPPPSTTTKFATTSTQPLPGVFGSRTKKPSSSTKPKNKKPKTSGFR